MQVLCPFCSQGRPVPIPCEADDAFALCESCGKRLRLHTFRAKEIRAQKQGDKYLYTCTFEGGLDKFYSAGPLALRQGDILTTVRRGRDVLGVADQERDRWYPVSPPSSSHPLLRALGLSLAWPVSLLAFVQLLRLGDKTWETALGSPVALAASLLLVIIFALAPLGLWLLRTVFPYGPGRERIRGYDPRL